MGTDDEAGCMGRAKKERSKQRAEVRAVLRYIEGGDAVEEKLKVGGQVVEIDGFGETVQLEAFRDALATGLQTHLLVCCAVHVCKWRLILNTMPNVCCR